MMPRMFDYVNSRIADTARDRYKTKKSQHLQRG